MKEFDKRIRLERFLRAFIWALCGAALIGGAVAGIEILSWKKWIGWIVGMTASIAAALAGIGIFIRYYIKNPITPVNNALRVDKEFGTNEKIVTREHFKEQSGVIIEKQRDDAEQTLKTLNPKKMPIRVSLFTIPAFVIGVGLCMADGFAVPKISATIHKEIINDSIDNINNKTEEIIDKIEEKINENSNISEDFKDELNKILEDLEKDLENDNDVDSRQDKIDEAKEKIDEALEEANSQEGISEEQKKANEDAAEQLKEELDQLAKLEDEEDEFEEDKDDKDELEKDKTDENQESGENQENNQENKEGTESSEGSASGKSDPSNNESSESGNGDSSGNSGTSETGSGSGASGGSGDTKYRSDDHVYTEKDGDTKYSDVIDEYYQDAIDDYRNSGNEDKDFEKSFYDYFNYLYGNDPENP